jgi:hypothetical protein
VKHALKIIFYARQITSDIRITPNFLVIGATRSGTTSLYNYLVSHPNIMPAFKKEVHFFDFNYSKGLSWYKANFPIKVLTKVKRFQSITGEATPYYIYHPHVPKRVFDTLPDVKLIALLRNPIDRAFSHYKRNIGRKVESLSFEDAINVEEDRLNGELEKMMEDETYYSPNLHAFSYLSMGRYYEQLQRWLKLFSKEDLLILRSEDFFINSGTVYKQIIDFLDLPSFELKKYDVYNYGSYEKMNEDTRESLKRYFKPYNNELKRKMSLDIKWD